MEIPADPNSLAALVADMLRRLQSLETAPRLTNSSVSDDDGVVRMMIGKLDEANNYGLRVLDANGTKVYEAGAAGVSFPRHEWSTLNPAELITVTAGTFATTWRSVTPYATGDGFQLQAYISTPAGTTGEARLLANVSGTPVSDVIALPDDTGDYREWRWDVPGLEAGTGPIVVDLQVRRLSGAGAIEVYRPLQAFDASAESIAATPGGL